MEKESLLYPSEKYVARLRKLGVLIDVDLGILGELLPVGTQTIRVNSHWYCLSGKAFYQDVREVDAKVQMLIYCVEQQIIKI